MYYVSWMPWIHDSKTVFRLAKFHRKVDRSAQYVCLPTMSNPKPLLKHDMTKVSPLNKAEKYKKRNEF